MNASSIEVEIIDFGHDLSSKNAKSQLGGGAGYVNGERYESQIIRPIETIAAEDLQRGIESVCAAVTKALKSATPESWSVEFSLGFKAGAKIPVLMSGEANAALKITLNWKKPSE